MSTSNHQELYLLYLNLQALRERLNQTVDEMEAHLLKLLPAQNKTRYQRFKNFKPNDYKKLVNPNLKNKQRLHIIK